MQNELIDLENRYLTASDTEKRFEVDKQYFHYLEKYIKADPKNIRYLIHLGVLSWEPFHKPEQAIAYLQEAIEYDPNNVEARFWLAKCYYHDFCAYDKAKKLLLEALQLNPHRADCLCILTSVIGDTTKNWDEAIGYLEEAIQYAPDWPILYLCLASLYLKINKIAAAELQVQRIEKLLPLPPLFPRNAIEDYYENIVTGRNNKNIEKHLAGLKKEIQEVKLSTVPPPIL
jgi:tetratricopeptide (TPR) repeat protein